MTTRDELVMALAGRYALGSRADRGRMLDEFAALTGHHRKHAMRLLRAGKSGTGCSPRPERRIYDQATREALIVIWEASDRICGKRLRPLVPILISAMERHGHLQLAPEVHAGLLAMSAATIDRALRAARGPSGGRPRRRSPPSAAVRRSVAVRTFSDWDNPPPGFMEADLVAHSGPTSKGSYVQTLTLTDIATGWTECAPVLVREQKLLTEVLSEMRKVLPFALLGFDTDNDSVFMNETVRDYCTTAGVEFTRSRERVSRSRPGFTARCPVARHNLLDYMTKSNSSRLFYLPPHTPEHNPDEYVNNNIKQAAGRRATPREGGGDGGAVSAHARLTMPGRRSTILLSGSRRPIRRLINHDTYLGAWLIKRSG